jgi:hypothetical protein
LLLTSSITYLGLRLLFISKAEKISTNSHHIVMDRSNLTPEQFEQRKADLKKFVGEPILFGNEEAVGVPDRFNQYWEEIQKAAKDRGVNPKSVAALGFQETYLQLNKYNKDSKASGMYQFIPSTAKLPGLIYKGVDYRLMVDNKDYRQDLTKSTLATAELKRQANERWGGDENMAVWDHHAGIKYPTMAMRSYLDEVYPDWDKSYDSIAKAMKALKVGYWDLRLRPTPTFAPKTWKLMMELLTAEHDYSADYPMRVELAQEYIEELASGNTKHFNETFAKYRKTLDKLHLSGEEAGEERIGPVWWHWYANIDRKQFVKDCDAMVKMHTGVLSKWVRVPDDSAKTGFLVDDVMGSVNPDLLSEDEKKHNEEHTDNHKYALPEVMGMSLWLVDLYKEVYKQEGAPYEPVTITSLGRSLWFQQMLMKMGNTGATDQLPLHTAGLAVDFAMGRLSDTAKFRWYFVLNESRSIGAISVSYEGKSKNTHIVPSPEWRERFKRYYFDRQSLFIKN